MIDLDEPTGSAWIERWHDLVTDVDPAHARAVLQGRAAMRRGGLEGPHVSRGQLRGSMADTQRQPLAVAIAWATAGPDQWQRAATALAGQVGLTASLLEHRLTPEIVDTLEAVGVQMVPSSLDELDLTCGCDQAGWCIHGFALLHAWVARLQVDATLALRLAGRDVAQLLAEVRKARGDAADVREPRPPTGSIEGVTVRPRRAAQPGWLLDDLGWAPGFDGSGALHHLVADAAQMAWQLASGEGAEVADEQLLLAQLRARHGASATVLAEAVGLDVAEVQQLLEQMYAQGLILKTGSAMAARYRAVTRGSMTTQ